MFQDKVPGFYYLAIFIILVVLSVIGASVYRLVNEFQTSTFKNNSYALLIVSKDSKFIYVDKEERSVLFLALGDISKFVKGKNTLEATFALGIPVNGILYDDTPPQNLDAFVNSGNEFRLVFGSDTQTKGVNRYDLHKLVASVRSSVKDRREEIRIDLFNQDAMKKIEEYFVDSAVRNTNQTIEIDNGTKINGLGNLLAIILTKQGYNVIAVRNAKSNPSSYISSEEENSEVINSLLGLTSFERKNTKASPASDITIFLGDDVESMLTP